MDLGNNDNGAANPLQFFNTSTANAGTAPPTVSFAFLDFSQLPVFTVKCNLKTGPQAGQTFIVTDLGRAMITGLCADIGMLAKRLLCGDLAARAPYFHNGSAATLLDLVNFYNDHFNLGLLEQDKQDLVNFMNAL